MDNHTVEFIRGLVHIRAPYDAFGELNPGYITCSGISPISRQDALHLANALVDASMELNRLNEEAGFECT